MKLKPLIVAACTAFIALPTWALSPGDIGFSTSKGQLPILDNQGRELILQGINDGSSKHTFMRRPHQTEAEIDFHAKELGYNTQRYLIFWDHIMPTKGVINHEYLDDLEARLDQFVDKKMHVILDMHQDNWSESCGGNGAPDWASSGQEQGAPGAPWWVKAGSPCVSNSVNAFYRNADGVQDEFVKAWGAVADRFKDHPAVIGYDLMNEPTQIDAIVDQLVYEMVDKTTTDIINIAVMTTIWVDGHPYNISTGIIKNEIRKLAEANNIPVPDSYIDNIAHVIISRNSGDWGGLNAVREFEGEMLTNMYQRVINRIRQVDQDKYLFVEPMSVSANDGHTTKLGYLSDPGSNGRRLGYIPHMYPRALHEGGAYVDSDYISVDRWEKASREFVYENNLAFLIGEFGHNNEAANGVQFLKDAVRMAERNKLGWEYWDRGDGWGPYNTETLEFRNNAEALVNIYPRAVAGRIENYRYNREEKTFELKYNNHSDATGVTEITVPPSVYDNDFVVESSDQEGTWSYSFDPEFGVVSVYHNPQQESHTITIKPEAGSSVAEYRELLNAKNGKCLNISGYLPAEGKPVVMWDCAGRTWQQWVYDEQNQYIRNYQNPDFCLSHGDAANAVEGGSVTLAKCVDSDDHRWLFDYKVTGSVIRNIYNSDLVLDAFGDESGSAVGQWSFHGRANQRWNWGWHDTNASMTTVIASMENGSSYDMKIWSKAHRCALEWDYDTDSDYERNAKFDCSSYGDMVTFNAYQDPVVNENGTLSITGTLYSYNRACGFEWDYDLDGNNERNAKWDCKGPADVVTLTTASDGQAVVITSNGCGLEWGWDLDDNERNAKWDCTPRYDGFKLHQVEPLTREDDMTGYKWNQINGSMRQISVAEDGSMWATDGSFNVYRRNGDSWQQIPGKLMHVSVGSAGNVWGVNQSHQIYRYNGNGWTLMQGDLKHISVGSDGSVWGVNANDEIWRWIEGNTWTKMPGLLRQISVGSANQIWGVNSDNAAYRWTGSGWQQMSNWIRYVSVAADGTVWATSPENKVWTYSDETSWIMVEGNLSQISTASATQVVGAVNSGGYKIYQRHFSESAESIALNPGDAGVDAEYSAGNLTLNAGQKIETASAQLIMQSDGNLVLYKKSTGQTLWDSATLGNDGAYATFQTDGNLVVYSASGYPLWASGTYNQGATLNLQSDLNLVIYNGIGQAAWATDTYQ